MTDSFPLLASSKPEHSKPELELAEHAAPGDGQAQQIELPRVEHVAQGQAHEQCAALVALGCTTAQGFHFSKPMPAHTAVEALRGTPHPAGTRPLRAVE